MSTDFWFGGEPNPYLVKNSVKLDESELTRTPATDDPHEYGQSSEIATANSTIADGAVATKVFEVNTYTGNGSTQTITTGTDLSGEGGLVWIKSMTAGYDHGFYDTVRGANQLLSSNDTSSSSAVTGGVSFTAEGFDTGSYVHLNAAGEDFIAWSFRKAPGFFDVVEWSGDSTPFREIPHSLGSQAGMVIAKRTDGSGQWAVYHTGLTVDGNGTETQSMFLNDTSVEGGYGFLADHARQTDTGFVFNQSAGNGWNTTGQEYVGYVFADTPGAIKCGTYAGDGSTSHQIDVGFQPQFILIKAKDGPTGWAMVSAQRPNDYLYANMPNDEFGGVLATVNSTGFELQVAGTAVNGNNLNYIYMAVADPGYIDITSSVSATTLAFNDPTSLDNDLKTELFAVGDKVQQDEPYVATTDDVSDITGADGYRIENSVIFKPDYRLSGTDPTNLIKNYTQQNTDPKKFTLSFWFKRTKLAYEVVFGTQLEVSAGDYVELSFQADNKMSFYGRTGGVSARVDTGAQVDVGTWTHCVIAVDTTIQSPTSDRVKIYLNGELQTDLYNVTYPTQNFEYTFFDDSSKDWMIGDNQTVGDTLYGPSSCYMADWQFVDGQALNALSFGEYDSNGVWQAKDAANLGTTSVITSAVETSGETTLIFTDDTNLTSGTEGNLVIQTATNTPTSSDITDVEAGFTQISTFVGNNGEAKFDTLANNLALLFDGTQSQANFGAVAGGSAFGFSIDLAATTLTGNRLVIEANGTNIESAGIGVQVDGVNKGNITSGTTTNYFDISVDGVQNVSLLTNYNAGSSGSYFSLYRIGIEVNSGDPYGAIEWIMNISGSPLDLTLTNNTGLTDFRVGDSVSQPGSYAPETSAITNVNSVTGPDYTNTGTYSYGGDHWNDIQTGGFSADGSVVWYARSNASGLSNSLAAKYTFATPITGVEKLEIEYVGSGSQTANTYIWANQNDGAALNPLSSGGSYAKADFTATLNGSTTLSSISAIAPLGSYFYIKSIWVNEKRLVDNESTSVLTLTDGTGLDNFSVGDRVKSTDLIGASNITAIGSNTLTVKYSNTGTNGLYAAGTFGGSKVLSQDYTSGTLSFWYYSNAAHDIKPINNQSLGYLRVRTDTASNNIEARDLNGGSQSFLTDNTVAVGSWHHFVYQIDGTNVTVFIDGVQKTPVLTGVKAESLLAGGIPTYFFNASNGSSASVLFDAYLVCGQVLEPTTFITGTGASTASKPFTDVFTAIGTFGADDFYLPFRSNNEGNPFENYAGTDLTLTGSATIYTLPYSGVTDKGTFTQWVVGESVTGPTFTPGDGIVTSIDISSNTITVNDTSAGTDKWTSGTGRTVVGPTFTGAVGTITDQAVASNTLDVNVTSGRFFSGSTAQIELSYGTNGFHLDFSEDDLGADASTSDNDWTANNLIATGYSIETQAGSGVGVPDSAFNGNIDDYAYASQTTTFTFDTPVPVTSGRIDIIGRNGWSYKAVTNVGDVSFTQGGSWPGTSGTYGYNFYTITGGITELYGITCEYNPAGNWTLAGVQVSGNPSSVGTDLIIATQNPVTRADSPTLYGTDTGLGNEVRGNYCVINPLSKNVDSVVVSGGNLLYEKSNTAGSWGTSYGSIGMRSGKWYWETEVIEISDNIAAGVSTPDVPTGGFFSGTYGLTPGYANPVAGQIWAFAVDMDAHTIQLYLNGVLDSEFTIPEEVDVLFPAFSCFGPYGSSSNPGIRANFGQKPWKYPAPAGFKALTTGNFE